MKICLCSRLNLSAICLLVCCVWPFFFSCHNQQGTYEVIPNEKVRQQNHSKYTEFANTLSVNLDTESFGNWFPADEPGKIEWKAQIEEHASSLNFGFSEFVLPPSAKVLICNSHNEKCQEFLPRKNVNHSLEMWTPILKGGVANFKISIDERDRKYLKFRISTINRGSINEDEKILDAEECLIDVLCLDDFPQIENWEKEIQSVGLISIEGTRLCTGVLLNNVRGDFTPYFLTARHCGINAENAGSVVVHWNYENTSCRFGMENNKEEGNGDLSVFNSGATFLADLQRSDFTLLRLNDDVVPEANAYFAGWSAKTETPTDVTTIHHANTEEKRITFGSGETSVTRHFGEDVDPNLDHIKVDQWAISSTSGGSSGAPLFDANHRVVGQLHGGLAACGNEESDWFGRFHTSWEGDSIPERQLRSWLDPDDLGIEEIDGIWNDLAPLALQISILQTNELICAGDMTAIIQVNIANGNGPYRYSIDGGESFQNENVFENLGGGVFSVLVRDADDNTSAIVPFFINEPPAIQINYNQLYNQLILDVSGGLPPFLYTYNGDITFDPIFNNLPQGNNTFSIIDANGCSAEVSIEVSYDAFQSQLIVEKEITCHDSQDGILVIQHSGTAGPYTYQLNNGPLSQVNRFENLLPGNYSARVIDSLGNTSVTVLVELIAPAILKAELLQIEENISVIVDGGVAPYMFSYNGGEFIESNQFSETEDVDIILVRDANGCEIELLNVFTTASEQALSIDFDLYPNPNYTGVIWLKNAKNILRYSITDTHGKVMKTDDFLEHQMGPFSIGIGNFSSGVYFFQAHLIDGKSKILKFIVL